MPPPATTIYLGLGSNLGDRARFISAAVAELEKREVLRHVHLSPLYETDAVADEPQPSYLNAVVRGDTALAPEALLAACLQIEGALGRVRPAGRGKAPRTIDIDVLLYGATVVDSPSLQVPHPAMLVRSFVLAPLRDVAEVGLRHPVSGAPLASADALSSSPGSPPRLYAAPTRG
ncbi:MAG: 2-amino-4-hydroxy-6-hydroxymethyldihydropteridine diphosphokinase [Bacteroidota bacterium]